MLRGVLPWPSSRTLRPVTWSSSLASSRSYFTIGVQVNDPTTLLLPFSSYGMRTRRGACVSHLLWPVWNVLVLIWVGAPPLAAGLMVKTRDAVNLSVACVAATILPPAQAMSVTLVMVTLGAAST